MYRSVYLLTCSITLRAKYSYLRYKDMHLWEKCNQGRGKKKEEKTFIEATSFGLQCPRAAHTLRSEQLQFKLRLTHTSGFEEESAIQLGPNPSQRTKL
jgi:hypothetical protein